MLASLSQIDRRKCPACHGEVVSEIWLILHRHERPKLWQRAHTLRTLTCPNGHQGPVRSPLLLFDPASPRALFSPGDERDPAFARAEGEYLLSRLMESLATQDKTRPLKVEWAPRDLLLVMLKDPRLNLGDLAPGTPESDETLRICADIRTGRASPSLLQKWINDAQLPSPLRAGIRFELASYLGREGLANSASLEAAIEEWRRVVQCYPRASDERRWAICALELALCYASRRVADPAANMTESLRLLDAALEVLTGDRYPEDFALAQSRKANLLLDIGSSERIDQSLVSFQLALNVYGKESYREDRALVLSNMSTAYLTRGDAGTADLRKAIELLEESLTVRIREADPSAWAISQMNLGLALSRLSSTETAAHFRAVEALRAAYVAFRESGDLSHQYAAAYNLGLTLAESDDPASAEEACDRLEESLPSLIAANRRTQVVDAMNLLSRAYLSWLRTDHGAIDTERICRRAVNTFKDQGHSEGAMRVNHEISLWLLRHSQDCPERLDLAGEVFERLLTHLSRSEYPDARASALANFATVLLLKGDGSRELNAVRARDCMDEALRILRSLPSTAKREEQVGLILRNRVVSEGPPRQRT